MAELWRKRKASAKGICCQPAHTHGALSCTLMSSQTLKFRETLNSSDTLMPGWRQGEGSSIRIEAAAAGDGLSVVAEVSHEESMAQMEASILSKSGRAAAGVGGLTAPLPILSGALRYTVGAYAKKLEDMHHQFERQLVADSSPRARA
jgi:hypothetical protein